MLNDDDSRPTPKFDAAKTDIIEPIWEACWNLRYTIPGIIILGFIIGQGAWQAPFLTGFATMFFVAPVALVAGIIYVRQKADRLRDAFHEDASDAAEDLLHLDPEDNPEYYSFFGEKGSKFLRPAPEYESSTMVVTDYSVTIYDGNHLDLPKLDADLSESTEELYFDQIGGVNYDDAAQEFWINRTDGKGNSFPSKREPEDALSDLQTRIREYKRQAVN